jgi:hypothetical protein
MQAFGLRRKLPMIPATREGWPANRLFLGWRPERLVGSFGLLLLGESLTFAFL